MDTATDQTHRRVIGPFTAHHLWAAIGALAVAAVLLVAITSPFSDTADETTLPVPGEAFYPIGEPGVGVAIGERPPPFAGAGAAPVVSLDGDIIEIADFTGRPVWVSFWATWCPPCQQETPDIQRAWQSNADSDLAVLAVDVQESADIVREYAATYGLTYDFAVDATGSAFRSWNVFGLPTHYFIGRDGTIRDRYFGPLSLSEMQRRLDLILASG